MKSTKKIIIGLIAVIALLITIAGALAVPSITSSTPSGTSVTLNTTQQQIFSMTVTNDDMSNLTYQWYVDGAPVGTPEENITVNHTSSYTFMSNVTGSHTVNVFVTGINPPLTKTWTVTVEEVAPESALTITSVKVNGKTSGKLSVSDLNDIKVEVSNDHDEKIKDITITVRILDVDGDDLEEESDEFDLSAGKENDETLEFDLSDEDLEEEDYTIEVEVSGEDTDGEDFSDLETLTVEVDREKDDIVILEAELEDSQVFCSANPQTSLNVKIKNIGENEQEDAKITVKNGELNMNLQKGNIDLDDYSGSDNDYEANLALNLEDAKQGTYTLDVAVYSEDSDLMDSKEVELQVLCDNEVSSQEDKSSTEYYADKELAAELQKKIDEYKAMQESQTASQGNFRQSDSYVLLLGVLVAMMFFAAALSATYLLVKRK
ncbi:MAG: hypothetical protein Q7S55_03640 [Nanoarchaeota archaeon]|nr:hypothetical protein [Nanoarchaeota archaeon]